MECILRCDHGMSGRAAVAASDSATAGSDSDSCKRGKLSRKPLNSSTVFQNLVEMAGIEPASESASTGTFSERSLRFSRPESGSFALSASHKRGADSAIPWFPCATGSSHRVFLHVWRRVRDLQVNPGRRRGAAIRPRMRDWFCFSRLN